MQQPLERYGVVVLLFLVALVAVVFFWDDGSDVDPQEPGEDTARVEGAVGNTPVETPTRSGRTERTTPQRRGASQGTAPNAMANGLQPGPSRESGAGLPLSRGTEAESGQDGRTRTYNYDDDADRRGVRPEDVDRDVVDPRRESEEPTRPPEGGSTPSNERRGRDELEVMNSLASGNVGDQRGSTTTPPVAERPPRTEPAPARTSNERGRRETPQGARKYTVGDDESLWRIAAKLLGKGERWREIAALNPNMNPDRILAGDVIFVPASAANAGTSAPSPSVTTASDGTRRYRVQSGDSLSRIAEKHLGGASRVAEIRALNGLSSDLIIAGTTLVLPGRGDAPDRNAIANVTPDPSPRRGAARNSGFYVR